MEPRKISQEGAKCETTRDQLLGGVVQLVQRAKGHRAGTDAVLLAASCPAQAQRIADLGAASGAVGLMAAALNPAAAVTLLEQDAGLVALARENISLNGLEVRMEAREADVFRLAAQPDLRETFDAVLTNPPFFDRGRTQVSPQPGRASAHHMEGNLRGWISGALTILAPKGELIMIHRADHLEAALASLSGRLGGITLRFIHPQVHALASRLIIAGVKGSRAPMSILPPLVLHDEHGFTPVAKSLHQGLARLASQP